MLLAIVSPCGEFLHVDNLADAVVFLMNNYNTKDIGEFVNIGTGRDLTIKELAEMIKDIVGFRGRIEWDKNKPDGLPREMFTPLNVKHILDSRNACPIKCITYFIRAKHISLGSLGRSNI